MVIASAQNKRGGVEKKPAIKFVISSSGAHNRILSNTTKFSTLVSSLKAGVDSAQLGGLA